MIRDDLEVRFRESVIIKKPVPCSTRYESEITTVILLPINIRFIKNQIKP